MSSPTKSDIHIDVALSNVSVMFKNDELVGERLFPSVPVEKDSNKYFIYGKEMFRTYSDVRAPGSRAKEVEWTLSTDSYSTVEHALAEPVADEDRSNADAPLKLETDTVEMLTAQILLRHEADSASKATTSGNYAAGNSSALAAGERWDNYASANSDPLEDGRAAISAIHQKTAKKANLAILGKQVFEALKNHPKIIERIKYSQLGVVTEDLLAMMWGVEEVLVAGALSLSSKEGQADSLSYLWGKNVIFAHVDPNAGIKSLSFGKTFRKQGFRQTRTWREDPRKADLYEVADKYDTKVVVNGAAYLYSTVIN